VSTRSWRCRRRPLRSVRHRRTDAPDVEPPDQGLFVAPVPTFRPQIVRTKKNPARWPGLRIQTYTAASSPEVRHEAVVQSGLELIDVVVVLEAGLDADTEERAVDRNIVVAKVEIVVLGLDGPILVERPLDAGANSPANPVVVAAGPAEQGGAEKRGVLGVVRALQRRAGLPIEQPVVVGDTDLSGPGRGPIGGGAQRAGKGTSRQKRPTKRGGACGVHIAPQDVAFPSDHQLAELISRADLDTADESAWVVRLDHRSANQ
jgi:hypothetical protein